jgi:hypothetical protein
VICNEIGDAKFCILIEEARDESKMEQMAIILRFVNKESFIRGEILLYCPYQKYYCINFKK